MHDPVTFEARLSAALEQYADGAPTDVEPLVYARAIAATGRRRQDLSVASGLRRWRASHVVARLGFVLATALLVVALIGTALIVGGQLVEREPSPIPSVLPSPSASASPSPTRGPSPIPSVLPSPSTSASPSPTVADSFDPPFEYLVRPATAMREVTSSLPAALVALVQGPASWYGGGDESARGVVVGSVREALTHPCPEGAPRVDVRDAPADFLHDVQTIAGIALGPVTPTTLDGRPALTAKVDVTDSACDFADLHWPDTGLTGRNHLVLYIPSRLIVAEVSDETVVVQIWAGTEQDLMAWLPVATDFVESIHFLEEPVSTPTATSGTTSGR